MLPNFGVPRLCQWAMHAGAWPNCRNDIPSDGRGTITPNAVRTCLLAGYLTICADHRRHWFGQIADGVMHPSAIGKLAQQCWDAIPDHMPHVDVGEFVVMPNHVHGIVVIRERLVDVRGRALGGGVGADGGGSRHGAPDTPTNASGNAYDAYGPVPDDPGTGMPGGDPDTANAHGPHRRARHDAPLRDPRKPPGIPRGALGRIVASYRSAVTRMAYRDGLLPQGTPIWQR